MHNLLHLGPRRPSQGSEKSWDEGSQQAVGESSATHGLMAILTSVRYLMAPGSEHLQQTRKSSAVVNGKQGQQL